MAHAYHLLERYIDVTIPGNRRSIMIKRISIVFLLFTVATVGQSVFAASPAEERAEIDAASAKVLNDLYKVQPGAKKAVNSAVGYAVFSNFGMKIFFAGGGSGKGYAVSGGKKTYMKMLEVQGQARGRGRLLPGRGRHRRRRVPLPDHRIGPCRRADGQGHQVLQGRRSQLSFSVRGSANRFTHCPGADDISSRNLVQPACRSVGRLNFSTHFVAVRRI
jgi:hypothetical protein